MPSRKRRRRFRGTPEEHETQALKQFDGAILQAELASEHAGKGNRCVAAFAAIKNAEAYFGSASGNRRWAPKTGLLEDRHSAAIRSLKYASDYFMRKCVLK